MKLTPYGQRVWNVFENFRAKDCVEAFGGNRNRVCRTSEIHISSRGVKVARDYLCRVCEVLPVRLLPASDIDQVTLELRGKRTNTSLNQMNSQIGMI
jgi:hypothetical protein